MTRVNAIGRQTISPTVVHGAGGVSPEASQQALRCAPRACARSLSRALPGAFKTLLDGANSAIIGPIADFQAKDDGIAIGWPSRIACWTLRSTTTPFPCSIPQFSGPAPGDYNLPLRLSLPSLPFTHWSHVVPFAPNGQTSSVPPWAPKLTHDAYTDAFTNKIVGIANEHSRDGRLSLDRAILERCHLGGGRKKRTDEEEHRKGLKNITTGRENANGRASSQSDHTAQNARLFAHFLNLTSRRVIAFYDAKYT